MQRQLYRGGGITGLYPRKKFGIGSWFQETKDKIVDRTRKLIPNELADVAVKAAPFVAMIPGGAPYAGIMRGLGRLDQRGDLTDAIKQGALTYGFGKYVAPTIRQGASNLYQGLTPTATTAGNTAKEAAIMKNAGATGTQPQGFFSKVLFGKEGGGVPVFGDKGLIGAGGNFSMKEAFGKGVPAVFAGSTLAAYAAQKALGDVGERESGESLEAYNKRRKGTVRQYLDFYYRRANKFRIPPEEMDAAAAKFVADNTKEYVSQGGRIGYQTGGITMANTLQENIRRNQAQAAANEGVLAAARSKLPGYTPATPGPYKETLTNEQITELNKFMQANPTVNTNTATMGPVLPVVGPRGPMPMGLMMPPSGNYAENFGSFGPEGIVIDGKRYYSEKEAIEDMGIERYNQFMSKGGRVGQMRGTGPNGLPGIPRMAPDGMEFDMRQNGGFQPLGAREKKDDVPAMLAKNEFVFTADAVRGAGNGDIELGAQKMYDTMKNLERRVT